jgi:hypothetical protein
VTSYRYDVPRRWRYELRISGEVVGRYRTLAAAKSDATNVPGARIRDRKARAGQPASWLYVGHIGGGWRVEEVR